MAFVICVRFPNVFCGPLSFMGFCCLWDFCFYIGFMLLCMQSFMHFVNFIIVMGSISFCVVFGVNSIF